MFKLVICTLISLFIVFVISDLVRYHRYRSLTRKGVMGVKYNTPHKLFELLRNIGFVMSFCKKKWRS